LYSPLTDPAHDLFEKMTKMDKNKRITAAEALKHPFITRKKQKIKI